MKILIVTKNQLKRIHSQILIKYSKTTFFTLIKMKNKDTSPLKSSLTELAAMQILKSFKNALSMQTLKSMISKLMRKSKMSQP